MIRKIVYGTGKYLYHIQRNDLTSLKLGENNVLARIHAANNNLRKLDVSKVKAITTLDVSFIQLPSLAVTNNPNLIELFVDNNPAISLDLKSNSKLKNEGNFTHVGMRRTIVKDGNSIDLKKIQPEIDLSKITELKGAVLQGSRLTDIAKDGVVDYIYDTGNGDSMEVTLYIKDKSIVKTPSLSQKDGKLVWNRIKGADGYVIYEKSGKTYKKSDTTTKTSYAVKPGSYQIRSYQIKEGKIVYSDPSDALTVKKVVAKVSGVKILSKKKCVFRSWKKVPKASGYEIYRATSKKADLNC